MKVKEVTVSRAVKVNTGNYENADIFISMTAEVDNDFETEADVARLLREKTKKEMLVALEAFYRFRTDTKMQSSAAIARRHGL